MLRIYRRKHLDVPQASDIMTTDIFMWYGNLSSYITCTSWGAHIQCAWLVFFPCCCIEYCISDLIHINCWCCYCKCVMEHVMVHLRDNISGECDDCLHWYYVVCCSHLFTFWEWYFTGRSWRVHFLWKKKEITHWWHSLSVHNIFDLLQVRFGASFVGLLWTKFV